MKAERLSYTLELSVSSREVRLQRYDGFVFRQIFPNFRLVIVFYLPYKIFERHNSVALNDIAMRKGPKGALDPGLSAMCRVPNEFKLSALQEP